MPWPLHDHPSDCAVGQHAADQRIARARGSWCGVWAGRRAQGASAVITPPRAPRRRRTDRRDRCAAWAASRPDAGGTHTSARGPSPGDVCGSCEEERERYPLGVEFCAVCVSVTSRLCVREKMPKGGFEPPRLVRHHPLKMACLPIPPLRHARSRKCYSLAVTAGHCQWLSRLYTPLLRLFWRLGWRRWGFLGRGWRGD